MRSSTEVPTPPTAATNLAMHAALTFRRATDAQEIVLRWLDADTSTFGGRGSLANDTQARIGLRPSTATSSMSPGWSLHS
jgi:hypothetical protein